MSAEEQTQILADFILTNVPSEPSRNEGAGEVAIRLIKRYRLAFRRIMDELGVPQPDYPAPVANAYRIAEEMLDGKQS